MNKIIAFLFIVLNSQLTFAQKTTDPTFHPTITTKTYPNNDGTIIYIDEGHNNHHIKNKDYQPLTDILVADGYQVRASKGKFDEELLGKIEILLLASAQPEGKSVTDSFTRLPTPDALTSEEVE